MCGRIGVVGLALACSAFAGVSGCGRSEQTERPRPTVVTFSGSVLGAEGKILRTQLDRFQEQHPEIRIEQRQTPDAADQRHQLYVQWLNAGVGEPDILQLDVIWTAEFAAAGWILALDRYVDDMQDFFEATRAASRWRGKVYAVPWFADVGMLYWRTDLLDHPPATLDELVSQAAAARKETGIEYGFVWQGARYEGLVCVFLEHLGAFGGRIIDDQGRVAVDSKEAVAALTFMRDAIDRTGVVPEAVLTWQEEQTRFAFQNGQTVFMRNWPYAYSLMQNRDESKVAGGFAVTTMPAMPGGSPTAALGGAQLAINANSKHPDEAYAVIEFLTRPEQMLERARVAGQFPTRESLYEEGGQLDGVLAVPAAKAREIIEHARPRPVTPIYAELSETLQIHLHRALTGQMEPQAALSQAAEEMRGLMRRFELRPENADGPSP